MQNDYFEARFSGSGGQGLMLIGDVLSQAVGCIEDKEVLLTKSYGPESRGGACRSELIVSGKAINYPAVSKPNLVLAMTQLACDSYHEDLSEDGILLVDEDLVKTIPQEIKNVYKVPFTRIAREKTGKPITANVVALGAISVLGGFVSEEAVHKAIVKLIPKNLREINEKAFSEGRTAARLLEVER